MKTKTYACYNLDLKERTCSSSGGIYPLLAKETLYHGGVVYAACYDDKPEASHIWLSD